MTKWWVLGVCFFLLYILDSMLEESATQKQAQLKKKKKVPRKTFLFVSFCFVWEWECFVCLFFSQMTRKGAAGEKIVLIVTTVYFWLHQQRPRVKPKFPSSSIGNEIHFLHYWGGSKEAKSLSLCFKHWPEGMRFLLHPHPPHHVTGNPWHTWGAWTSTLTYQ